MHLLKTEFFILTDSISISQIKNTVFIIYIVLNGNGSVVSFFGRTAIAVFFDNNVIITIQTGNYFINFYSGKAQGIGCQTPPIIIIIPPSASGLLQLGSCYGYYHFSIGRLRDCNFFSAIILPVIEIIGNAGSK